MASKFTVYIIVRPKLRPIFDRWGNLAKKDHRRASLRGFENDADIVPVARRRTAEQKAAQLELILGQIANYCPVISRNTIVKNSTYIFEHYLASDSGSLWVSVHR
jgi:hypothetical protein